MRTRAYFDTLWGDEWPRVDQLEPYFRLSPAGVSPIQARKGEGNFSIEGVDGTEHLGRENGRVDVQLLLWTDPVFGGLLQHQKTGGGIRETHLSKGDLQRRLEWVFSASGTPLSVGLFVPIDKAWGALKQFIEAKGNLPDAIEWVDERNLPADTFPPPHEWKRLKRAI